MWERIYEGMEIKIVVEKAEVKKYLNLNNFVSMAQI